MHQHNHIQPTDQRIHYMTHAPTAGRRTHNTSRAIRLGQRRDEGTTANTGAGVKASVQRPSPASRRRDSSRVYLGESFADVSQRGRARAPVDVTLPEAVDNPRLSHAHQGRSLISQAHGAKTSTMTTHNLPKHSTKVAHTTVHGRNRPSSKHHI